MYLIGKISDKLAYSIASGLKLDKNQQEIVAYGAFNLLQVLWALLWTVIFGLAFNVLTGAMIVTFTIALLRKYSGGAHLSSPNRCAVIGGIISSVLALAAVKVFSLINIKLIISLEMVCLVIGYHNISKLAPVDSPAKPITKVEKRKLLRRQSILVFNIMSIIILMLTFLYFRYNNDLLLQWSRLVFVGIMWQVLTLTSIGHQFLNKIDETFKIKKGGN